MMRRDTVQLSRSKRQNENEREKRVRREKRVSDSHKSMIRNG